MLRVVDVSRWSEIFVASAAAITADRAPAELEATLAAMLEEARATWPQLAIAPDVFVRHLAQRVPLDDVVASLAIVRVADLYLACAAAHGDPAALAAFETTVLSKIAGYLLRTGVAPDVNDEIQQILRERLLVAQPDRPPRIATFTGRGSLLGWVRMAAARVAIDVQARRKPDVPLDAEAAIEIRSADPDPELHYLRGRYGRELRDAFQDTLRDLPPREAAILRLFFLDGMSAQAIGVAYRVHARTVQKWLAAARARILENTRRLLAERLDVAPPELESLIALVRSQLDVSISTFLPRRPA